MRLLRFKKFEQVNDNQIAGQLSKKEAASKLLFATKAPRREENKKLKGQNFVSFVPSSWP